MAHQTGFYDRQGKPIDAAEFDGLWADRDYVHVAHSNVLGLPVSTLWLGESADSENPPLIFQTSTLGRGTDRQVFRWATEAEAIAGHDRIVTALCDVRPTDLAAIVPNSYHRGIRR